jgi:hypothetical protein
LEAAPFVPAEEVLDGGGEVDAGDEGEGTAGVLARMPGELVERELRLTYRSFFMSAIADMKRRLFTSSSAIQFCARNALFFWRPPSARFLAGSY